VSSKDLIGTFTLRYPYGTETLRLDSGGHYEQSFVTNDGRDSANTRGKWELQQDALDKDAQNVILHDALLVDDNFGHLSSDYRAVQPGLHVFRIHKTFGAIELVRNEDKGFSYKKN
jgi:hypothetical protein